MAPSGLRSRRCDVSVGSFLTKLRCPNHVWFSPVSDRTADIASGPVRAKGGSDPDSRRCETAIVRHIENDSARRRSIVNLGTIVSNECKALMNVCAMVRSVSP
jgi:hypothetical protein